MKIKHYIVTYKNNDMLEQSINGIFATETDHERLVYVISNHSGDEYAGDHDVSFLRNQTRPDFSTGHLSRNWNQGILNGLRSIKDPDADLLILSQNDCLFQENYLEVCLQLHENFDLVTYGAGDNCVSYTPRAIARVGLWDERFCNIGYQEADYFLRAAIYLRERASINDGAVHGREHNPIDNVGAVIRDVPSGFARRDEAHMASMQYHRQSYGMFALKWGIDPERWGAEYLNVGQRINNYIFYPYFERDVETLEEQKYLAFF